MSCFVKLDDGSFTIREYHHPMVDLLDQYPVIGRLEEEMFATLLGKPVVRSAKLYGGQYLSEFVVEP